MDAKEGKSEDESNLKDSRPNEEIKVSDNKDNDNEKITNMDDTLDKNKESDGMESEKKQEKDSKEKVEESNHVTNGDIEMKFILDNKHLHTALSIPGSRSGTPNTARKRKNRHLDEMNMAEMISLSGVESLCTISNYDAMSTRGFDDDEEEGGGDQEDGDDVDKGIGVHHVLSVLLAMMSVAIVLLLYFLVPCPIEPANWIVGMEGIAVSSPLRLLDVNRDGMDDIIFGFSIEELTDPSGVDTQLCVNLNLSAPCGGGVMAVSGWRGDVLWRLDVNHTSINSLVCNQIDVNDDGQFDCLAAGNNGVLMAINTKTGHILWESDPSVTVPGGTYFQPQTLPRDLDDDDVYDLVVTHGAQSKQDEDEVGRVMLLSGKTGQSLGSFLTMPDGHASVSPPIIFQTSDDQEATPYIVFGSRQVSGTESNNPGSMWMITLDRLLCHVTGSECIDSTIDDHQSNSIEDDVVELVRGRGDGFLLPAIVADMTMDGVNDLIIVSHDALVTVVNGSSFKPLWSRQLDVASVYRPYSVTAPGRFNHDEVPDLMIQLSPHEDSSNTTNKIVILDGLTGAELWHSVTGSSFDNQPANFKPSPLSLKGKEEKDAFTFWVEDLQQDGTTTQGYADRCSDLISSYPTLNLVVMDRDMAMDPPSLLSFRPYKPINGSQNNTQSSDATTNQPISTTVAGHMTSLAAGEVSSTMVVDVTPVLGGDLTPTQTLSSTLSSGRVRRSTYEDCTMMEPIISSTGVIEDLDDDGSLEVVIAINMMSTDLGSNPSHQPQRNLTIQRKNIERALNENNRIQLTQPYLSPSVENSTVSGSIFNHLNLLETKLQTWLGYMGSKADGRYT